MHDAVIGLGSNLGSRASLLSAAIALLCDAPGLVLRDRSRLYLTPPLGPAQPDFLNAAVRVRWAGTPHGLLDLLLHVEARLGRQRRVRWGPRTLDLDLLWWSGGPVRTPRLSVPHPGLPERAFALAPLLDVAPELRATLGPRLDAAGGVPPSLAWPVPPALDRPSGPHLDEAQATASAVDALCATLPGGQGPRQVWAWNATPGAAAADESPTLCAPLSRALWPLAWGLAPCAAVVLDTTRPPWRGLLLVRRVAPPVPTAPTVPRVLLKKDIPGGEAWLTLLPESV